MFIKIYLNGIAKAMDISNSIRINKYSMPATILSAWREVGDEMISSMITQSNSIHEKSNKFKFLQLNMISLRDNRILQMKNIILRKENTLTKRINGTQKEFCNMSEIGNNSRLHINSILKKSESLSERIANIKSMTTVNFSNPHMDSILKKSESLSERIANIKSMTTVNFSNPHMDSILKKSESLSARIHGISNKF